MFEINACRAGMELDGVQLHLRLDESLQVSPHSLPSSSSSSSVSLLSLQVLEGA